MQGMQIMTNGSMMTIRSKARVINGIAMSKPTIVMNNVTGVNARAYPRAMKCR